MVQDTLRENAPSRDTRFVEAASLLRRLTTYLRDDKRVVAAYLAHFGAGEGFGCEDDAWSSLNVHAVLGDEHMDALATERRAFAAGLQEPLLFGEAAQNAPQRGYDLMALFDGAAGPYEVDWYWHSKSLTAIPAETRVLFDRVGLPTSNEPIPWGYLGEADIPLALKQVWADRTKADAWTDEARNTSSLFWAMLLISAKGIVRDPTGANVSFGGMLSNLIRDIRAHLGESGARETANADDPAAATAAEKLSALRDLGSQMESLMREASSRGAGMPLAAVPRAYAFLDVIDSAVATQGQD